MFCLSFSVSRSPVIRTPTVTLARLNSEKVQMSVGKQNGGDHSNGVNSDDSEDELFERVPL
jgi:hypothetical protein